MYDRKNPQSNEKKIVKDSDNEFDRERTTQV